MSNTKAERTTRPLLQSHPSIQRALHPNAADQAARQSGASPGAALINSVRFTLKSLGYSGALTPPVNASIRWLREGLPDETLRQMIAPSVHALAEAPPLRIKVLDLRDQHPGLQTKYPLDGAARIKFLGRPDLHGALFLSSKIQDPVLIRSGVRDVGATGGLCPRRDQSGESDPQLRISKWGDAYLRRLLVSAAEHNLGPFGPESALRQYGLRLAWPRAQRGPRNGRRWQWRESWRYCY